MWFRKKMPDAVLFRYRMRDGSHARQETVRTFIADGKRWCKFRGQHLLLKDDGSVLGDADTHKWEAL